MLKPLIYRLIDPVLLKIGARLRHLESIHGIDGYIKHSYSAVMAKTAMIYPEAEIVNHGVPADICIGEFSCIRGQLAVNVAGARIRIGSYSFVGPGSRIWSIRSVEIGNFVLVSHLVDIHDNDSHPVNAKERRNHPVALFENKEQVDFVGVAGSPVRIEDDVWIGFKSSIMKGVTIGRGAIVAAGSLVNKDVPPFTLVAGCPAREVRSLRQPSAITGR